MAFSFGSTAQPAGGTAFGAAAPKPAFGGFGATTPQPSTGFGGFGAAPAATGFGAAPAATGFGAAPAAAPATGFGGFGAAPAAAPATGFGGFGAAPAAAPAAGFGGFGAAPAGAPATGFGAAPAAAPAAGFGGFGAAPAAAPATGFGATGGFGAPASSAAGFGGFGSAATSQPQTGFGGFGAAATQPAATGFGGFGTTASTPGFGGGFGATSAAKPTGFGAPNTGFGAPNTGFGAPNTGFGTTNTGFGATTSTGFGAQPQQQQPANPVDSLFTAVLHCNLFNDERDGIIARWNMLQASWGQGKAFFSNQALPVNLTPENPFCRFKAIGYCAIPKHENKDGLVSIMFKKKTSEIEAGKAQLTSSLTQLLGNKPGINVNVESVKAIGTDSTEVVVTVQETQQNGTSRKVPATDLHSFLNTQANNLKTMGVEMVVPKLSFSKADIDQYLAEPPSGVDARLWKQAQADNPDSSKLIPVPMIGFRALQSRTSAQDIQAKAQGGRLDTIATDIGELQKKAADTQAALIEAKRKQLELSHRVLKVLVRQESTRKIGFTITQQEEVIRGQLEALQAELATPTQFKGRLNELLSQVRLQSQTAVLSGGEKYTLDQFAVNDIKSVLKDQQEGIQALVNCVKDDLKDLSVMVTGLDDTKTQS